jgi:5'-3' exonuclease
MTTVLEDNTTMVTGGIYNSLRMIQRIERDYLQPEGEVYFLFDNCHSGINKRKEIDPDYKANREKKDEAFYRSLDFLHLVLLNYKNNYKTVKVEGSEADDLVDTLVKMNPDDSILLVSNDLDWFRAIRENVHVAKYEKGNYHIYDKDEFVEKYGFEPTVTKMCMYKSFKGDSGDNVPIGVEGIRTKVLVKLVSEFDSIQDIIRHVDELDYVSDTFKERIKENTPRLLMNYKLVDYLDISEEQINEGTYDCSFNPRTLNSLYQTLEFDVSRLDTRVYQFYPINKKGGSFFKREKIPRA